MTQVSSILLLLAKLDSFHLTNLVHPIMQALHVLVGLGIRNGQVGVKKDGVDGVHCLSMGAEVCVILVEIGMYLVDVTIFTNCLTCELKQICSELPISGIGVESGKAHHAFEEEWNCYLLGPIVVDFVVFTVRQNFCLDLLGVGVVNAMSHLFIVLRCLLLTPCSCFLRKLFAGNLEGLMVYLTLLRDEINGEANLI